MLSRLIQIAPPSVEPISVPEAQSFLQVTNDADLIAQMIAAAREDLEFRTQRSWITQRWEVALDSWPQAIELPRSPLISVESIGYRDYFGAEATLAPSSYAVAPGTPGRITPAYGSNYLRFSTVSIRYTAGFGPSADDVPSNLRLALKHLVAHMYDNRSNDAVEPRIIERLIARWKWATYA